MKKLLTICAIAGMLLASRAGGTTIARGFDHFQTQPGSLWDFFYNPIPADFFGPGSEPFDGQVMLQGVPVNNGNTTDTLVERLEGSDFPGAQATIPTEMVALNLVSVDPITVMFAGDHEELWEVMVMLDPSQLHIGQYMLTHPPTVPGGQVQQTDSFFDVFFDIEFEKLNNLGGMEMLQRRQLMVLQNTVDWSYTAPPQFDFSDNGGIFMGIEPEPFRNGAAVVPQTLLFHGGELSLGLSLAEVPEPATMGLLGLGSLGLLIRRRKY